MVNHTNFTKDKLTMKRTHLRLKEANEELQQYGVECSKKDIVEVVEDNSLKFLVINQEPAFFYHDNKLIPTLKYLQHHSLLKKITIDMGAIKFIVNGADVMRPGIVEIEEGIQKDDFIVIVDQNNKKPLAVGIALCNSEEMKALPKGKAIKTIHYVGDEVWKVDLK